MKPYANHLKPRSSITSRRSFLQRTTAAAATFSIVPGYVLGTRGLDALASFSRSW